MQRYNLQVLGLCKTRWTQPLKMVPRAQREAQHLSRFWTLVVICLFVSRLFTQNSLAYISYSQQELLDIGSCNSVNFIDGLQLIPEIAKTTEATKPAPLTGS